MVVNGVKRPVYFASSTLSPAEQNYSQAHREALAIIFAVRKFHNYLYGQNKFIIYTDNRGISQLFDPDKKMPAVAAARLQRWVVELSMYKFKIVFRESFKMSHADGLSRLPMKELTHDQPISIKYFNFSNENPINLNDVKHYMSQDLILSKVYEYILNGWPNKIPKELSRYFSEKANLSLEDGCIYYGSRLVIPLNLREKVLSNLHNNHTGIVRMKMIARSYIWWPAYNKDIESYVQSCEICQTSQNVKRNVGIRSWPACSYPFQRVHIDFFDFAGKKYFLYVDAYSKFCEVILMSSTVLQCVTDKLLNIFSNYGLPTELVSDNGPPFHSYHFKQFCDSHGILCTKSPPWHPQSNGQAENFVETVKRTFKRFCQGMEQKLSIQDKINKFLVGHRNTPSTVTGKTPSELIFAYKPKTLLDCLNNKLKIKTDLNKGTINTKTNYNKKRNIENKFTSKYKVGDEVLYLNHIKNYIKWISAKVVQVVSPATYLIKIDSHIRFVHEGQIKLSTLNKNCVFLPQTQGIADNLESHNRSTLEPPNSSASNDELPILRRSSRVRKPPNRFNSTYNSNCIKYLKYNLKK